MHTPCRDSERRGWEHRSRAAGENGRGGMEGNEMMAMPTHIHDVPSSPPPRGVHPMAAPLNAFLQAACCTHGRSRGTLSA
eukprot:627515-Pyramimonas_sp.AAC.1